MTEPTREGVGCRGIALTAMVLIAIAVGAWTAGFYLGESSTCVGACEWTSFTLLFVGGPVSAIFTVLGGTDLVIGWPIDLIAWVMIATGHQKLSDEASPFSHLWRTWTIRTLLAVVSYAAVLALLVTRVR